MLWFHPFCWQPSITAEVFRVMLHSTPAAATAEAARTLAPQRQLHNTRRLETGPTAAQGAGFTTRTRLMLMGGTLPRATQVNFVRGQCCQPLLHDRSQGRSNLMPPLVHMQYVIAHTLTAAEYGTQAHIVLIQAARSWTRQSAATAMPSRVL